MYSLVLLFLLVKNKSVPQKVSAGCKETYVDYELYIKKPDQDLVQIQRKILSFFIHPSIHPSIFFRSSGARSRGQQS